MKLMYSRRNPRDFPVVIIFLQSMVYLTVFADVPVLGRFWDFSISLFFQDS
jgi:hypothetical protein